MMKKLLKRLISPILKWWFKRYNSKPQSYSYKGIKTIIAPGVFPPKLTFSSRLLLKHIETLDLKDKTLLELGCGSGIISLYSAKKGAHVTASDISEGALSELKISAQENQLGVTIVKSDLFENIDQPYFDHIIINPPYYPKNPQNVSEKAWYCGENFEYFQNLFQQLTKYAETQSEIIMVLSEDCDVPTIRNIAQMNSLKLSQFKVHKSLWEMNYLFRIVKHG